MDYIIGRWQKGLGIRIMRGNSTDLTASNWKIEQWNWNQEIRVISSLELQLGI